MFVVIYHRKDNYMYYGKSVSGLGSILILGSTLNEAQRIYLYPHWDLSCVCVYTA